MSDKRLTTLRPSGWLFGVDADGRTEEYETAQCKHCGGHYPIVPGSGRVRGYCLNCQGPVCGQEACRVCVPTEQLLENLEKGRPADYRPIQASVGAELPKTPSGIILGSG